MPKFSRFRLYRQRFRLGTDLLALRLKMARLEWQEYQNGWSALLLALAALLVCALLGGLSLLFALQAALPATVAAWTFAALCVLCVLLVAILLWYIAALRRRQRNFLQETLHGLREDIALLRGDDSARTRIDRHETDTE